MTTGKNWRLILLLLVSICSFNFSTRQGVNIVFIGDSITEGGEEAGVPPVFTADFIKQKLGNRNIKFSNQGVSGTTTVDFLPSTATYFNKVVKVANDFYPDKQATLIFSIMLGTNDSAIDGPLGSPVSSDSYRDNLKVIVDRLLNDYPESKIIIHKPIWYSPNTYNRSRYLQEGLTRLQTYFPVIDELIKNYSKTNPGHVFAGDKDAFGYFKKHHLTHMQHENGQQGIFYLHPNEKGSKKLGQFWGEAILKILQNGKEK
jgi:lysophospholipase L1-like esterase